MQNNKSGQTFLLSLSTAFEYYDFVIYALMANYLGPLFFPMYIMTSPSVCNLPNQKCTLIILKCRRGPPLNRLSDRYFVMNILM